MSYGQVNDLVLDIYIYEVSSIEARPYRSNKIKLDSRIVNCHFVGHSKKLRGFMFYNPSSKSFF